MAAALGDRLRAAALSLWDEEGLDEAIEQALAVHLPLGSSRALRGASLHIQPTAALVAVDVDTGGASPEDANAAAVEVLAEQIVLRGLAGMMVIDLAAPRRGAEAHKRQMAQALARALADDPAQAQVVGVSPMGLIELRRTRRGVPLADLFTPPAEATVLAALRRLVVDAEAERAAGCVSDPRLSLSAAELALVQGPLAMARAEAEAQIGRAVRVTGRLVGD